MGLPRELTRADILAVLDWIDLHPDEIPKNQQVRKFALLRDRNKDKQYPPKFVIRKAYALIHHSDWTGAFSGGTQANNFFIRKQFNIWDRVNGRFVGLEAIDEDQERIFREGRVLTKFEKHISIERHGSLPKHVKGLRLKKDPNLHCDVCGFSFVETYGDIGDGFIEAHHLVPLSQQRGERTVRAADLALVCSNCHRMLHSSVDLLRLDQLKERVISYRK